MTKRITVGRSATITATFTEDDTEDVLDPGAVGVVVTSWDGTVVVDTTADVSAAYVASLALDPFADLDVLSVVWTSDNGHSLTETIEVVGGSYFSLAELRAQRLADKGRYPAANLIAARDWIVDLVESTAATSFVERLVVQERSKVQCPLSLSQPWARRIVGLKLDGTTADATGLVPFGGSVTLKPYVHTPFVGMWATATIAYVAGYSKAPPADLKAAMLIAAREHVIRSVTETANERATSVSTPDGSWSFLSTPGQRGAITGIPRADEVIGRWADQVRIPAIA